MMSRMARPTLSFRMTASPCARSRSVTADGASRATFEGSAQAVADRTDNPKPFRRQGPPPRARRERPRRIPDLIGIAQRGAEQARAIGFERYYPFPLRQHDPAQA